LKKQENKARIILKKLRKEEFFGELPFFIQCPYEETAKSKTFSTIYNISKESFLGILTAFPDDYVYFF